MYILDFLVLKLLKYETAWSTWELFECEGEMDIDQEKGKTRSVLKVVW